MLKFHSIKILFIFIFFQSIVLQAQNPRYERIDTDDLDTMDEFISFFGDSTLNQYKVFFTGENHQFAEANSFLEYKLLTYLNKYQNVNHFLFEQSPAVGYIMTQIAVNNDEDFKEFLEDKYHKTFYDLVTNIESYNKSLSDDKKIKIHGIDVERFPAFSIFALGKLVEGKSTEGKEGFIIETIRALATSEFVDSSPEEIYNDGGVGVNLTGDKINAWETLETIINSSKEMEDELKKLLNDDYLLFTQIIDGVENGYKWYHDERDGDLSAPLTRERYMLEQFNIVYKNNPNGKFYGQFGRCHLHSRKAAKRCYSHDMQSIASRINMQSDSTIYGKVLTIPVYYNKAKAFDKKVIDDLDLDDSFFEEDQVSIIDLDYLDNDESIIGFENDLKYVIVSNASKELQTNDYNFNYTLNEYHLGVSYGNRFFRRLSNLNFALKNNNITGFTNKFTNYNIAFDYIGMNEMAYHLSYSFMPRVSNGDRFDLRGSSFSYGGGYPMGNKYFVAIVGVNYTYGQMYLIENNDGTVPNLMQSEGNNITVYRNDVFSIDPNLDVRITLPIISFNAKVGYSWDVSGKYWKLDGKMKDFTKTSFNSTYIQVGVSLNYKDIF